MSTDPKTCPACSATNLSPPGPYACFKDHVRYKFMGKMGTFTRKDLTIQGDTARFCLECGYMMLFASDEDMQQLRAAVAEKS